MSAANTLTPASQKRAARRRALKQMGLLLVGAFSFCGVLFGIAAGIVGAHHGAWILFAIVVTLAFLALMVWSSVAVARMVWADHRRAVELRQERARPFVEMIEERNRLLPPRRTTFLRITPLRWLVAELIPFGFLAVGVLPGTAWPSIAAPFGIIAFLFGSPLSFVYLYKMHGAPSGWILPLIAVYLPSFVVCSVALGEWHGRGLAIHITSAWLIAISVLLVSLAGVVAASVVTGERWVRRNQLKVAPNFKISMALPYGNRGFWSWMWLSRQPGMRHGNVPSGTGS